MTNPTSTDEISDKINLVLEEAADDLRELGMQDPAPYRAMMTHGLTNLCDCLCADHLRSDLQRYRNWLDHVIEQCGPVQQ
jgi:hypothetical protein